MKRIALLTVAVIGLSSLNGCTKPFGSPAEQAAVRALEATYPPIAASAYRDIDARLLAGEINEAGAALLRERVYEHGQTIATMRTGGE
jgi:hypothetical protein